MTIVIALVYAVMGSLAATHSQEIKPFKISVDESVLVDLKERLSKTRWPDQIPGSGWDYGVDAAYMRQLVDYWRTTYDWRKQESLLNEFPQFTTAIDGIQLHFFHVRSSHPNALQGIVFRRLRLQQRALTQHRVDLPRRTGGNKEMRFQPDRLLGCRYHFSGKERRLTEVHRKVISDVRA